MRNLLINPVLNKEFKLRFRSFKGFLGLLFYLLAVGTVILGFIFIQMQSSSMGYFRPSQSREMFILMSFLQLGLILFITPGLTAGVISGERERQTLNILLTTNQSSMSIILSKLVSSVSYLLLMIFASLPLYSIVFLFGGISPGQMLKTLVFYIFTTFVFGSIGILFSTLIRKTIVSMVTTYGTALFFAGGTAFLFLISIEFYQMSNGVQPSSNPFPYFMAMLNPFIVMFGFLEPEIFRDITQKTGVDMPMWVSYVISYTVILILAVTISIRKLRPNMKVK